MAAEKKRLARWFSGKPRAKPLEGGRQRAVFRGQDAPQRAGMGIFAAGPLTLAVVLTNAGAPFAAPNAPSIRLQSRERSRPQDGESERSLRESIRRGNERPHRSTGCLARAGNSKSSEPDRSLRPSF